MRLPKALYVKVDGPKDEEYLLAADNMSDLGIDVGDKTKIGLYKLEGFYIAEGTIDTSKLIRAKP